MIRRKFVSRKLKDYEFINQAGSRRGGFYHLSTLLYRGRDIAEHKSFYINRTWECYEFQTSMMATIYELKENLARTLLEVFKDKNDIKRMTPKYKAEFEKELENNENYKIYNLMTKELRG